MSTLGKDKPDDWNGLLDTSGKKQAPQMLTGEEGLKIVLKKQEEMKQKKELSKPKFYPTCNDCTKEGCGGKKDVGYDARKCTLKKQYEKGRVWFTCEGVEQTSYDGSGTSYDGEGRVYFKKIGDIIYVSDKTCKAPLTFFHKKDLSKLTLPKKVAKATDLTEETATGILGSILLETTPSTHIQTLDGEEQEVQPVRLTVEEKIKVEKILTGNPLEYIDELQSHRIVGEEANRRALTLIKSSVYAEKPLHNRVQAESSSGKNHLESSILTCMPPEDVIEMSRITPTWLERTKTPLKHKCLSIQQATHGFSKGDAMHVALSERKTKLGTVDKEGRAHDMEVEGPIQFGFTTTNIWLSQHIETRTLEIHIDESKEQTARIVEKQKEYAKADWTEKEDIEKLKQVRPIMKWLRDEGVKDVIIPYIGPLEIATEKLEIRRQFPQIVELIKQVARFNQLKRPLLETQKGEKKIVASYKDAEYVFTKLTIVLQRTTKEVTDEDLRRIKVFYQAYSNEDKQFTFRETMKTFDITKSEAKKWLKKMETTGLLEVTTGGGQRKANKYQVISTEGQAKPFYTILNSISEPICKNELKNYLKQYCHTVFKNGYTVFSLETRSREKREFQKKN